MQAAVPALPPSRAAPPPSPPSLRPPSRRRLLERGAEGEEQLWTVARVMSGEEYEQVRLPRGGAAAGLAGWLAGWLAALLPDRR